MKASQDRVFQGFLPPGVGVSGGATVRGASFSQTKKRKKLHRSFVACVGRNQVNAVGGFIKTLASFVNRRCLSFHLCLKCHLDDIADDGARVTVRWGRPAGSVSDLDDRGLQRAPSKWAVCGKRRFEPARQGCLRCTIGNLRSDCTACPNGHPDNQNPDTRPSSNRPSSNQRHGRSPISWTILSSSSLRTKLRLYWAHSFHVQRGPLMSSLTFAISNKLLALH